MWKFILDYKPSLLVLSIAVLSFVIPVLIYFVNQKIHKAADPPWKNKQQKQKKGKKKKEKKKAKK
ncbi:hypothetical protein EV207_107130 [Scopulibacillus darangshiensis]|uniref:Uncharacterized protein n=1 Tax=Scopulibacillus darangshiensis TaxID=442528 RepID=A0A4R2P782_9BACL|nr:hypothetical protein [Scopulibacillus darangshiensis]TCP30034.1 hypothetical protein EV207_107130 [Scopulibacillus darangshiensis]